jgi:hypothetical protein
MASFFKILIAVVGLTTPSRAQSIDQQIIASGGEALTNTNGSIEFTVGEPVIQTMDNVSANSNLTNGFHQIIISVTQVSENIKMAGLKVFPNPANELVHVTFNEEQKNALIELYDMSGRLLQSHTINNYSFDLNFASYADGVYYLKVNQTNSYKIIKIH